MEAMIMFFAFIIGTMGITKWAASKTKSASDFYTAGGGITGFQNGLVSHLNWILKFHWIIF
jgi:cation/acetate symporter